LVFLEFVGSFEANFFHAWSAGGHLEALRRLKYAFLEELS
jgi:hypothetical protein